jgi:hypothetical protein
LSDNTEGKESARKLVGMFQLKEGQTNEELAAEIWAAWQQAQGKPEIPSEPPE